MVRDSLSSFIFTRSQSSARSAALIAMSSSTNAVSFSLQPITKLNRSLSAELVAFRSESFRVLLRCQNSFCLLHVLGLARFGTACFHMLGLHCIHLLALLGCQVEVA